MAGGVHRKAQSYRNRIRNGSFEERLCAWNSSGAFTLTADDGHLVHTGTQAVLLAGTNAFITQTVPAGRGARLQFSAHIRGVGNLTNSPVVVRLRWVDASGSFLGTALEIFIPQKQLNKTGWTFLWENTNLAPAGTAGVNIRVDAPYSEDEAAVVLDDLVIR